MSIKLLFIAVTHATTSTRGRTLLLFVIRDYIGTTPLRNLQDMLTADIERIWGSLGKPFKLEDCQLTDFFDLAFTALPHKILVPDKFESEVMKLRRKFVNKAEEGYLIKPIYHKHVPADGVAIRMKAIWVGFWQKNFERGQLVRRNKFRTPEFMIHHHLYLRIHRHVYPRQPRQWHFNR